MTLGESGRMTEAADGRLEQAYDLIQQERLEEAIAILQPILLSEPTNADAWWLWANAVEEPDDARQALQKVLELNPDHAQARQLLEQLDQLYAPVEEAETASFFFGESADFEDLLADTDVQESVETVEADTVRVPEAVPEAPPPPPAEEIPRIQELGREEAGGTPALDLGSFLASEEGFPPFEEEMPDFGDTASAGLAAEGRAVKQPRRRPILRTVLLVVLLIVVILAGAVLINLNRPVTPAAPPPAEETPVLSVAMQTALEAAASAANARSELLGGSATAQLEARIGGAVLVIRVCRPAGTDLTLAMGVAMEAAANSSILVQDEVAAVGADLVNCARDDVLMRALVPIDQAVAYASGRLSPEAFRAAWQWMP